MRREVIPTILSSGKKQFLERLENISKASKKIQIDIMDGKFVKSKSIAIKDIPELKKYKNDFEAHLMVSRPRRWLVDVKKKGFKRVIFHYETQSTKEKAEEIIRIIKYMDMKPVMAINPETKINEIEPLIKKIKHILIMGVHPGKEKQRLLKDTYAKIKKLRSINQSLNIQVDGGVNEKTAKLLFKAGANILNSGSYVSNSKDPDKAIKNLLK